MISTKINQQIQMNDAAVRWSYSLQKKNVYFHSIIIFLLNHTNELNWISNQIWIKHTAETCSAMYCTSKKKKKRDGLSFMQNLDGEPVPYDMSAVRLTVFPQLISNFVLVILGK